MSVEKIIGKGAFGQVAKGTVSNSEGDLGQLQWPLECSKV